MIKVAKNDANAVLQFFDKLANAVEKSPAKFGLTAHGAKVAMVYIDSASDDFERKTFGEDSLRTRQAEVGRGRRAEDIQTEPDEPYMKTFDNPSAPLQTEPDEPYMAEFGTDNTDEVNDLYPTGTFTPRQSSRRQERYNPFD